MITLNEIAYNIRNLAYGGRNSTENTISLKQIKHWIHYHRAKLIADNIDKGITNNESLYQQMSFTARNSTSSSINRYYESLDSYLLDSSIAAPVRNTTYLENMPVYSNINGDLILSGEWLANSSLSQSAPGSSSQKNQDKNTRNQYGYEISSSQVRGDFRNLGSHSFWTPRPLQLKNDQGTKTIELTRYTFSPDDIATEVDESAGGYGHKGIALYRAEPAAGLFSDFNKFTDNNNPRYMQYTASHNRQTHGSENYIVFTGLQVSPNYHGNLNTPGFKKLFWKYRGYGKMILENPTEIEMMWPLYHSIKKEWDDAVTPYPIPMEYVSDLVQRVVQFEMQLELKTTPDVISDGADDNLKLKQRSGAQVQR